MQPLPTRSSSTASTPTAAGRRPETAHSAAVRELLELAARSDGARRASARNRAIELELPFARNLARRYEGRRVPLEDLEQVAALALVKAVDGFDVTRGSDFRSYSVPTILGELRRYFRDRGWSVSMPRGLQELSSEVYAGMDALSQQLGRRPSPAEIARAVGLAETQVSAALQAHQAYKASSLDGWSDQSHDPHERSYLDRLGQLDAGYDEAEARTCLAAVLGLLGPREQHILGLRFWGQLSQLEIAREVGLSQMHVSRLITTALLTLRNALEGRPRELSIRQATARSRAVADGAISGPAAA